MQIEFKSVDADYRLGPIKSKNVLKNIKIQIKPNRVTAIIGKTGSGKSTLLKLMNGLLLPTKGQVIVGDYLIDHKVGKQTLKSIRKEIGMVFQFAETVKEDIMFGPLNFGYSKESAERKTYEVIEQVGLTEDILVRSPLELSGGQKRRVALAGILALQPGVLVLDEPGAGLDSVIKKQILDYLKEWQQKSQASMVMVSHDMEDVAYYADDLIVLEQGTVIFHDTVRNVLSQLKPDNRWGIELPEARLLQLELEDKLDQRFEKTCLTITELVEEMKRVGIV